MNIYGIGCDIVSVSRINAIYQKFNTKFIKKIFSQKEQELIKYNHNTINYIAKRYAAKEAFSKAIHQGIGQFSFKDIEIFNDSFGKPYFSLNTLDKLKNVKNISCTAYLSLADEREFAIAYVLIKQK